MSRPPYGTKDAYVPLTAETLSQVARPSRLDTIPEPADIEACPLLRQTV
jgi:hypothetical protein